MTLGRLRRRTGQGVGPTDTVRSRARTSLTAADVGSFVNTATATGTAGNGQQVSGGAVTAQVAAAPAGRHGRARRDEDRHQADGAQEGRPKKKAVVHKTKAVKAAKHTKAKKKVTKKAKPARPVLAGAHFTG